MTKEILMSMQGDEDIVRLATASHPAQAHLWQQVLQEAGIQSQAVGDYLNASFGDIPGLRPELWVHRRDVDRALEVLRSSHSPPDVDENSDDVTESV
jgi:hypothetical protein